MNAEQKIVPPSSSFLEGMANYHQVLSEKYKNTNPDDAKLADDATALISFNGYYTLEGTPGAFFAIDTNMHIKEATLTPIYDVSLIVSLDGKTSHRVPFSGSFDGVTLTHRSEKPGGLEFHLNFTRPADAGGVTAKCTGTVGPSGVESLPVLTGSTYNNPIPANLFAGEFYEQEPLILASGKSVKAAVKVMQILDDYQVLYDYGKNDGNLTAVSSYTYNMNMYYFAFSLDPNNTASPSVQLIMGTAGEGGFACNNMTVDTEGVQSRNLQTIPFFPDVPSELPNILSEELAAFSGYYQLPSIAAKAFISIQAQYAVFEGILDIYCVKIAVSLDGINSKGYYFDGNHMSFNDNVLSLPEQNIELTFKRHYEASQKSLVTISGSIEGHNNISGATLFNPVPLSVFGGVPMTNPADNSSIVIDSDSKISYNGKVLDNFIYVPLMYILASPWFDPQTKKVVKPNTVLSLGTDGTSGNVSIVIDVATNKTSFVYAIPPKSQH